MVQEPCTLLSTEVQERMYDYSVVSDVLYSVAIFKSIVSMSIVSTDHIKGGCRERSSNERSTY